SMAMVPAVGRSSVVSIWIVVVLPAPLGPRKAKISPERTWNETPSTARTSPKVLTRFSTWIMGWTALLAGSADGNAARERRVEGVEAGGRRRRQAGPGAHVRAAAEAGPGDQFRPPVAVEVGRGHRDAPREAGVVGVEVL